MATNTINLIQKIRLRAKLLTTIRAFFNSLNVLEVETPLLCQYSATTPHIDPVLVHDNNGNNRFLQTSPEYAMKRLLASKAGDIFQLCKVFRNEEFGNLHNPEFTMLEWYKINFDHHQLMQEVQHLLNTCGLNYQSRKISYREIFNKFLSIDPCLAELKDLKKLINNNIPLSQSFKDFLQDATKQDCQELLFSHIIEPKLTTNIIWFIYNYPIEQAALAKINKDQDNVAIAERFEVYVNGIELANGFHELLDPVLQEQRFIEDQKMRQKLNKPYLAIDPYLIAALNTGIPNCSGVALGVDRLLMLLMETSSIKDVLCFPWDIA